MFGKTRSMAPTRAARLIWVLCGALMLAASTSCSRRPGPVAAQKQAIRLRFMVFGDSAELKAYQRVIDKFESDQFDIKIDLLHAKDPQAHQQLLGAAFLENRPPDVFLLSYRRYSALASRNKLQPLQSYLAASGKLRENDFYPAALAPYRRSGELLGIPQNLSNLAVYYNKRLFAAANLPPPSEGWTWTDFVSAARKLTRDSDGTGTVDQYGLGTEVTLQRLAPFVWQNGGELVDRPADPTRLVLDSGSSLQALEWFVNLRRRHKVVPTLGEEESFSSDERFRSGKLAMILNSRRAVPHYREIRGLDWDVAPLPRGRRVADVLHSEGYFIAKSSPHRDAAWRFVEFAASEPGQVLTAAAGRTVPSLVKVAESDVFLNPEFRPRHSEVFLAAVPITRAVPVHPGWGMVEDAANRELRNLFYSDAPVPEAAARIVSVTKPYFTPQ
jgi:multiple sugar transport system substrate-binding protein